ncbi:MAG: DsbC family protein [Betaproteobacteria bacterium]|nr:DsbC family protein [Betaproteobacteria bacterium]
MRGLPILVTAILAVSSHAGDVAVDPAKAIAEKLKQRYPVTHIDQVLPSPLPGVYEVVMGRNVAFSDADGRYFIFGHLYDMQSQRDLTAERKESLAKVDWLALPLENSIKFVNGKGERVLAVFSDPDCPFCKKVEVELAKLDNATIYLFPYPVQSLHPNAAAKSAAIWCAPDRARAWREALTGVKTPSAATKDECVVPISVNVALAERLGINGTPTLIARDGRLLPGAATAERISAWLDAGL